MPAIISTLTSKGFFEGEASVQAPAFDGVADIWEGWTLVRTDHSGWLADGFLEGQWVEICDENATCGRFKIQVIRGTNTTKDDELELRYVRQGTNPAPAATFEDSLAGFVDGEFTVTRIAAVAHFDDTNWFVEQAVVLQADINFRVPIARQGVKVFPVTTHGFWKLLGPVTVEGGVSGADRSLNLGLKLPGEHDGPLFKIGTQPPESKQIDVLNLFNDGSKQNRSGTMTSTTLSGLGLPKDLDFGPVYSSGNPQTFGEPAIFPGGIGYGTVQFVDGVFTTNGAKSTIEVVNLLLGIGNDAVDVQGTLDPDDPVKLSGTLVIQPRNAGALGASDIGGIDLTRPTPFDWKAQGFLVGQTVKISGFAGSWVVVGFSDDNVNDTTNFTRMHLKGAILTPGQIAAAPLETLTEVVDVPTTATPASGGGTLVRTDPTGNWLADGFVVGQRVFVDGVGPYDIVGLFDAVGADGRFETMVLANGPAMLSGVALRDIRSVKRTITAGDVPVTATVPVTIVGGPYGGTVTRTDPGSWITDGFIEGQQVMIGGLDGAWRVRRIENNGKTLRLERGLELPSLSGTRTVFWAGPHGGLTVVHGGGNSPLTIDFAMDTTFTPAAGPTPATATLRRLDGRSWIDSGFSIGQRVQVGGAGNTTWTIVGFENSACPFSDPFPGCGFDSTMVLHRVFSGGTASQGDIPTVTNVERPVHVADPALVSTTAPINVSVQPASAGNPNGQPTTTLTCQVAGCFGVVGPNGVRFEPGQQVRISGVAGPFTVISVNAGQMVLQGAALTPTVTINATTGLATPTFPTLKVWAYDADVDGGIRIGGDRIVVCNLSPSADEPCRGPNGDEQIAGPSSPLVVYGDTSQDGVWYGGEPDSVKGHEFGPKPFDPFWKLPEQENEDDEWLFPLANPYDFAGNDTIDASGLFSWITCTATDCALPSVGFTAYGGERDDLIIGSQAGDHLAGGSGNDTIVGLRGVDHIYGDSGINVSVLTRGLSIEVVNRSPAPTLDPRPIDPLSPLDPPIKPGDFTLTPAAAPNRDLMLAGRDLIHGDGTISYTVGRTVHVATTPTTGPQTAFDDIICGDHCSVLMDVRDPNEPSPKLQRIQTTRLSEVLAVFSEALQNGDDDTIFGNIGRDLIIAGAGHDMADGDEQDDIVFGDNVTALWRRIGDIRSLRFQTLYGGELYTRTDRPLPAGYPGPLPTADTSGVLLVNAIARDFRDPDGAPWWAEYTVDYAALHSFDIEDGQHSAGTFGNDYLAGGAHHDLVFGQLGNDIVQGDGSIDSAVGADFHVGGSRTQDGCPTTTDPASSDPTHAGTCDVTGDLDLIPSFDATTDGEDYIEGGGGNDIVFGGNGQDDIVGGSSDFFSLDDAHADALSGDPFYNQPGDIGVQTGADLRPDGSDLLFGGSGLHTGRNDNGHDAQGNPIPLGAVMPGFQHTIDADVIVGDNGRIIRITGTFGTDRCDNTPNDGASGCDALGATKYVGFVYDDQYGSAIVVRGVTLLDYTPGGPDFRPDRFGNEPFPGDVCDSDSAPETQEDCSEPLPLSPGRNRWDSPGWVEIAGNDEVHGGLSDDVVYVGGGSDVVFGDAADDDIIGGWGNDWLSGGTGSDGVLGDDGRISTSRNSTTGWTIAANPVPCVGAGYAGTCFSEPLYAVTAFRPQNATGTACPEQHTPLCGDYIDQYISTPGEVQTAVININGDLKKSVDLTPFNLTPPSGADQPKFDANNSDDVIFGGLGGHILPNYPLIIGHRNNEEPPIGLSRGVQGDFLHGGAGDDAIAGGEAILNAYAQVYRNGVLFDRVADGSVVAQAVRTDWTRPYNPGDLLHFGEDSDAWHDNGPIVNRLGEFALYDEYDPRRTIELNADATVNKVQTGLAWFLNLYANEGAQMDGCISYAPNGTCLAHEFRHSDGSDAIFGDLGNDWLVGGTGQDEIFGGWGNDLLNADDVMTTLGDGAFGDQKGKKIQPSPNDIPDTHPLYQDRAYGGAGLDVLIGNTGGDRLIDWVGEFNSYIVPFAPFGIATVSRQVPPWLFEFLYELARNVGADQTRHEDGGDVDRRGEPHGELGLVTQKDHGLWQDQTGGPSDPQPGNIPGGSRDVLRSADFNDGQFAMFAPDSGAFAVTSGTLQVAASSLGQDAVAVLYLDAYLPKYYEVEARISTQKPTGGWKANSYLIFDYYGPDDFLFAGIDVSINKFVMGHYDPSNPYYKWVIDKQVPLQVKPDTWYDLKVAVNGTTITIVINGTTTVSHTYPARIVDGEVLGLNTGLVGFGSDNSRGAVDNFKVSILPPRLMLDRTERFDDTADMWVGTDDDLGTWNVDATAKNYVGAGVPAVSLVDLEGLQISADAYVELDVTVLNGTSTAGLVFDWYSATDYKFVVLDRAANKVVIGHRRGSSNVVDATYSVTLAGADRAMNVVLKGASVSVRVANIITGFGYNAPLADGRIGVVGQSGTVVFDNLRVRTDDASFNEYNPNQITVSVGDASVNEGNSGTTTVNVAITLSGPSTVPVSISWVTAVGTASPGSDYVFASGTTVFNPGETTKNVTLSVVGDALVEGNETFRLQITDVTVVSIANGSGTITIVDDDVPPPPPTPTVTVTSADNAASETPGNTATFTLTRSSSTGTLAVNVSLSGTATFGTDYTVTAAGGTISGNVVTFNSGSATVTLTITPVDDTAVESSEGVTLLLGTGTGYTVGSPASASATIADNDTAPPGATLSIADVTTLEGDNGGYWLSITITRAGSTSGTASVNWTTVAGTATAGVDYTTASGTVNFSNGQSTATITVRINNDKTDEPNETFTVVLSNATNATIVKAVGTITINDNDGALVAAAMPTSSAAGSSLDEGDIRELLAAAIRAWVATGADPRSLDGVHVRIDDLPGAMLADTTGTTITLDRDAAGWGWDRSVRSPSDGMDLFSVLLHELGHVLGYGHDAGGVMRDELAPGSLLALEIATAGPVGGAHTSALPAVAEGPTQVARGTVGVPPLPTVQHPPLWNRAPVSDVVDVVTPALGGAQRAVVVTADAFTATAGDLVAADPSRAAVYLWAALVGVLAIGGRRRPATRRIS
ncbi:MAG TPA: Calx-beta domain-containing protein [Ilumatobacteraceae bacterium]